MPDNWGALIVVSFALAAVGAFSVAVPQLILLFRVWDSEDAPFTLKTVLWTSALGIALGWRCAVFVDFAYFDQRYLGTIDRRWTVETAMALYIVVAVLYATVLYHATVTFGRRP